MLGYMDKAGWLRVDRQAMCSEARRRVAAVAGASVLAVTSTATAAVRPNPGHVQDAYKAPAGHVLKD